MDKLFLFIVILIVAAAITNASQGRLYSSDPEKEIRDRILAPLRSAGISETTDELLAALSHENAQVREGAVLLLADKAMTDRIVEALKGRLEDPVDSVALRAAHGLHRFGDHSWKPKILKMLEPDVRKRDSLLTIRAAGLLARAEDSSGWEVVREGLFSDDPAKVAQASQEAEYFDRLQLKGVAGTSTRIKILDVCIDAFKTSNEETQILLLAPISKVARTDDLPRLIDLTEAAQSESVRDSLAIVQTIVRTKRSNR